MDVGRASEVKAFLRTMRARLRPQDIGLPVADRRRRMPGLRIEEVAAVAGVSLTWYSALEGGKGVRVSANLLERVGDALRLDSEERAFLAALVRPLPNGGLGRGADPVLQAVVDGFRTGPAFVSDRLWNVRVYNGAAGSIYGFAGAADPNLLVRMLTEPALRELHEDWARIARQMVEIFHRTFADAPDDEEAIGLVTRLRNESAEFSDWWDMYGLRRFVPTEAVLRHPTMGRLALTYASFVVPASDADHAPLVIVLQPAADAETLARLDGTVRRSNPVPPGV